MRARPVGRRSAEPPRIQPVTEPTPEQLEQLSSVAGTAPGSKPANIFATLAHHPRLLRRFNQFGGTLLFRGLLPAREREIVILRVGWNCGSVYEFGQHTIIGRAAGLADSEVSALAGGDISQFVEHEQALIALADDLCSEDSASDATWDQLRARWSDAELVELLVLAGFYRLVAGFLNSAAVQLDPGVPGWPEDVQ